MNDKRTTISHLQLFFLLVQSQIGIGLLSLPADIQKSAGGDGWMSVLVAGAATQALLLLFWTLYRRFPRRTLPEISVIVFGKRLGKAINLVFCAFFIAIAALASALYLQTIGNWLLILTPKWLLLVLIIAACSYLAIENLRIIARFYVVSSFLFVLLLALSVLNFANEMHLSYLMPVGQSGIVPILSGSYNTFFAMLGFEIALFGFAHVRSEPLKLLRTVSLANLFVTLLYAYYVVICLVSFSPDALGRLQDPILFMFKGLSYPVLERLDLIFLSLWIIPMTTSVITYMVMAGKSVARRKGTYRAAVFAIAAVVFAVAFALGGLEDMEPTGRWIQNAYMAALGGIPIVMLLLSFSRGTKGKGTTP